MTHRLINRSIPLALAAAAVMSPAATGAGAAEPIGDHAAALAVNDVAAVDGGYELGHPRHRAVFSSDGIRISPRSCGPAWTWRLSRVSAGGSGTSIAAAAPVAPDRPDTLVVRYDRIALDEEYVLGAGSIEQRFILHLPPPLHGRDLVIEGTIDCDGAFSASSRQWQWLGDGGLVWLGPAVVFDAEGTVLPSRFEVTAGSTRLVVDGVALAGAAYPVTIDPEIGVNDFRISTTGVDGDPTYDATSPSAAYNEMWDEYLVVWTADYSVPNDEEIFGQRLDAAGTRVGTRFKISSTGPSGEPGYKARYADVVWNSYWNEYLVVWQGHHPRGGPLVKEDEIWGRILMADGTPALFADLIRISNMGPDENTAFHAYEPAVTYNSHDDEYLVVWHGNKGGEGLHMNEFEIYAQRLDDVGVEVGLNDFRISDMGGTGDPSFNAFRPDVAYNSHANQYLIVWYGDDDTGGLVDDELEIYGQLIDATGAGVGPNDYRLSDMGGIGDPAFDGRYPKVAYNPDDDQYLVVWQGDDNVGGLVDDEIEIFSQRLSADLAGLGANDYRLSDMGGIGDPSFGGYRPAVAYNAATHEYAVVWYGNDNVGGTVDGEDEIYCQLLTADVVGVGPNDARISDIGGTGDPLFGVGDFYFDPVGVVAHPGSGEFLALWTADDPDVGLVYGEFEIFGQRVIQAMFVDGFESGTTSGWSVTAP